MREFATISLNISKKEQFIGRSVNCYVAYVRKTRSDDLYESRGNESELTIRGIPNYDRENVRTYVSLYKTEN